MSDIVVRVDGLSKRYRLGARQKDHGTLRDHLMSGIKSLLNRNGYRGGSAEPLGSAGSTVDVNFFWALQDVSFEVKRGQTVGIIGRNGAGKSTLLKLLSRITEPTDGRIELDGRVSALLEVGTGFHSELTGRENVYLNGTILGMKRAEITRKFDEIVAFAEIEQFVDTPVKRYSSGMAMRLGFAVAAHLESEILIVDEVLAVGDAAFQRKCLGKMEGVAKEGRTIFFVSHNMPAVTRLCERGILLEEGKLCRDGRSHEVVNAYLHSELGTMSSREWLDPIKAPRGEVARLRAVRVRTKDGQSAEKFDIRKPVGLEMEYDVLKSGYKLMPSIELWNEEGICLLDVPEQDPTWRGRIRQPGRYRSTAWIPANFLAEGTMFVSVALETLDPLVMQFYERQVVAFSVIDTCEGDSARGDFAGKLRGVVRPLLEWTTVLNPENSRSELFSGDYQTRY
ncbi:MAG TPA: ABC transporter ATP-binding protein [Nitrospira sp.]|nr:ABC transporter ATP-binding protein [Nitrospira sp.]